MDAPDFQPAPSFSFIVPALNEEGCIAACIRSIRVQGDAPLEIIVVDNGCTDHTVAIARRLGCFVVREEKPGLSHARNRGAEVATGDILCFVDADGVLSKDWLHYAKRCFSDPTVSAVSGLSIYAHPNPLKCLLYNSYVLTSNLGAVLSSQLFSRMIFAGNNFAIRRGIFVRIGGYEPVIGEGLWLSRRFWRQPNQRGMLCVRMILWNSSRGFEQRGFARTVLYWIRGTLNRASQTGYTYKSRPVQAELDAQPSAHDSE